MGIRGKLALCTLLAVVVTAPAALAHTSRRHHAHRASAPAPYITVGVVGNVPSASVLDPAERAIEAQSHTLRRYWGTPLVRFGSGAAGLMLFFDPQRSPTGAADWHGPGQAFLYMPTVPWDEGWTGTASHEIMEALVDPSGRATLGSLSLEICDPVASWYYPIHGIWVSDFVTPAWFSGAPGRLDARGRLRTPRRAAPGGSLYSATQGSM